MSYNEIQAIFHAEIITNTGKIFIFLVVSCLNEEASVLFWGHFYLMSHFEVRIET